jgi:hypothetical protein
MKSILCVTLVLFGFISVFSQERTISKAEFEAVSKKPNRYAVLAWKGKSFRNVRTNEVKLNGSKPIDSFLKSTMEFVPNYAPESNLLYVTHSIIENRIGSKITKSESIRIGGKNYKRKDNEPWIVEIVEVKPKSATTETTTPSTSIGTEIESIIESVNREVERIIEYKYLGTEKLNNQNANVYAVIMKTKHIHLASNKERQNIKTTKYWFSEDGVILKEDDIAESRGEAGTFTFYNYITSVWELDPNIKVEAPVLN